MLLRADLPACRACRFTKEHPKHAKPTSHPYRPACSSLREFASQSILAPAFGSAPTTWEAEAHPATFPDGSPHFMSCNAGFHDVIFATTCQPSWTVLRSRLRNADSPVVQSSQTNLSLGCSMQCMGRADSLPLTS
jgi:hypothetical protein